MSTLLASLQRELLEMKSKTTFPGKYAFFRWSLRRCRHQIHVPSCWRQERDACGNRPRTLARSSWQSTVMQPGRKRAFCQSLTVLQCKRICGDAFDVPVSFRWALHAIVDARARIRNLAPVSKWLISPLRADEWRSSQPLKQVLGWSSTPQLHRPPSLPSNSQLH